MPRTLEPAVKTQLDLLHKGALADTKEMAIAMQKKDNAAFIESRNARKLKIIEMRGLKQ